MTTETTQEKPDKWPLFVMPRKGTMKPPRPYLTLDVESRDWRHADILGIYDGETYRQYWRADYLIRDLERRYKGFDIYAHYGGGFDFWFLLPDLRARFKDIELSRQRSRLGSIKVKGPDLRFVDTYNFMPYALKEIVEAYDLGEYFDITGDWAHVGDLELQRRNRSDCELLYKAVAKWRDFAKAANFKPDVTSIGSAAVDCWLRHLRKPIRCQWEGRDLVKNAYYGGRVEVHTYNARDAWWYDLNSAYGWSLAQPVPLGEGIDLGEKHFDRNLLRTPSVIAFVHCRISIPDFLPVGPLPVRIKDGSTSGGYKVTYPTGCTVHGVWCSLELEQALNFGCEIIEIYGARYYSAKALFKRWIGDMYELRNTWPLFAKRLTNATYGKLGQGLECHSLHIDPDVETIKKKQMVPYLAPHYGIWLNSGISKAPTKLLPIAAAVASRVRARLTNVLMSIGALGHQLIYCDTDSVVYTGDELPTSYGIGLGLGEWKLVGHVKRWQCLQSRWYSADVAAIGDASVQIKLASAGIERLTEKDFARLCQGIGIDRQRWIGYHSQIEAVVAEGKGFPQYERIQINYDPDERDRLAFVAQDLSDIEERIYYTATPR